jgi:phosphatidylserine decarboxylase
MIATYAAAQILRVLPRERITRAVGRLCDLPLPQAVTSAVVGIYSRAYRVDMAEAVTPDGGFTSFDAFFTRLLRDGARPLCPDEGALVSPADGRIDSFGIIERDGVFQVKGKDYSAIDLVGDADDARRYEGGQFAIVYLSPRDYHRVHSPAGGTISLVRSFPGEYFPVNGFGETHVPKLFSVNRRVAICIDSETHGRVTVVMVAAMIVGRITVSGIDARDVPFGEHRIEPGYAVKRGDEIGMFHLGSTAVIFVEPGKARPWGIQGGAIRMGESLHGADTR